MQLAIRRRRFLSALVLAGTGLGARFVSGVEPLQRRGAPRLLLSLAAYSFRNYYKDSGHPREKEADQSRRIDQFQFIDFCAENGCQGAELTSHYFLGELTDDFLLKVRRHAPNLVERFFRDLTEVVVREGSFRLEKNARARAKLEEIKADTSRKTD